MATLTLEAFINSIRNLYQQPQTFANYNVNFIEIFNTINSHLEIFNDNAQNLIENVLPLFPLPEYTLPHMAVLFSIVSQMQHVNHSNLNIAQAVPISNSSQNQIASINQETFLLNIENCIKLADHKQVEVAHEIYSELCHFYTGKLIQFNRAMRGLLVLQKAIQNLQMSSDSDLVKIHKLTTVHSDILQLSLASKNFTIALNLISVEILDIHKPHNSTFDSKYLLGYFYYAGCVHAAMKQYEAAVFFLEQALTVPAVAVSQIMIESYKKILLIGLISKGKLPSLPKYTSRIVLSQIKPMCALYHEIAAAYVNYDLDKLNALCLKYEESLQVDNNRGLVKQLQQSFYKKNIQKLTKTFITLSLADMALKVKLPSAKEAEIYMLNMIKDGEIFATINQKDGMVSFHDNPEKYNNPAIMEKLTKQMFEYIQMDSNIKEMDKEITTHPHYIQKCQNHSSSSSILVDDSIENLQSTSISSLRHQQSNSNLMI